MNINSKNKIRSLNKTLKQIKQYEKDIKLLTDKELKDKTEYFRKKMKDVGNKVEDLLPEVYAVVKEAFIRVLKIEVYDVQLLGALVMQEGNLIEMKTGEGKTLVAVFPAYLYALKRKGVHIVTVNDYLAKRDKENMGKIFEFLGMSVGVITSSSSVKERKEAYRCDVTYGANKEFGFDYLRDNLVNKEDNIVQRGLEYAIIDEADSVLIDEAQSPLIISSSKNKTNPYYYVKANQFVRRLKGISIDRDDVKNKEYQKMLDKYDYVFDLNTKSVFLTEKGIRKAEEDYEIENFYELRNIKNIHSVHQALVAHNIMRKDIDYIVDDGKVIVVDQNIGRVSIGKMFNNGLQQAIEAKEFLENTNEGEILATITFQNYFKMYKKISGMTGTIMSARDEIENVYGLQSFEIPTNKPIKRIDKKMKIFLSNDERNKAIVEEIKSTYMVGQPILIGTNSIKTSEVLSELLNVEKIPHEILNAKNPKEEAKIIEKAGGLNKVTIATNMAGRGTDIKLQNEEVRRLGGLKVIGVELNDSKRIDDQLRGRSGRQGDIGESQFFISIEQDNLKPFVEYKKYDTQSSLRKKCIKAQNKFENRNYTSRKIEIKYDEIINIQRNIIYKQRKNIIETDNIESIASDYINELIDIYKTRDDAVIRKIEQNLGEEISIIRKQAKNKYVENKKIFVNDFNNIQKDIMIKVIDFRWKKHLNMMEALKSGMGLRVYGRKNPAIEYNIEGYNLFKELQEDIIEDIGMNILFLTKK